MIEKKYLLMAARSLAVDTHQSIASFSSTHPAKPVVTNPSDGAGGWSSTFACCGWTVTMQDSDVVIRALVLRALEAEDG